MDLGNRGPRGKGRKLFLGPFRGNPEDGWKRVDSGGSGGNAARL